MLAILRSSFFSCCGFTRFLKTYWYLLNLVEVKHWVWSPSITNVAGTSKSWLDGWWTKRWVGAAAHKILPPSPPPRRHISQWSEIENYIWKPFWTLYWTVTWCFSKNGSFIRTGIPSRCKFRNQYLMQKSTIYCVACSWQGQVVSTFKA